MSILFMDNQFNLTYIFSVLKKWKRHILVFVLLCTIAGGITTLVLPKQYLSTAIIVPANPKLADKNFMYSNNLLELNDVYGVEEDLDRLLTNCKLQSHFSKLIDSFKLITHYKIDDSKKAFDEAVQQLKKNTIIQKTETGAVSIMIWDTDKNLAAQLVNQLIAYTNDKMAATNQQVNQTYLTNLEKQLTEKQQQYNTVLASDKNADIKEAERKSLLELISQDTKAVSQLKAATYANLPALLVLDKAVPSTVADKPKLSFWLSLSFIGSLLFAIVLVLVIETFRKNK
jgi:LPS O-antigen subunit length determinant protein (WzzB/FepE family)